jgi:predicted Zn-ribbon and HTH transcriptional regulator
MRKLWNYFRCQTCGHEYRKRGYQKVAPKCPKCGGQGKHTGRLSGF